MKPNRLKAMLLAGEPAYGPVCTQGSVDSVEIAAHAGFDFVFVDGQHGGFNRESIREAARAVQTTQTTPLARVSASCDAGQIEYLLDSGYPALTFPMVNTARQAQRLVDAAYYPPLGHRSIGNCRATLYFGDDYYDKFNAELLLMVIIESIQAVQNIDEIMSIDGISGCQIGTSDLSASLGLPRTKLGGTDSKELDDAIARVCDATVAAGKIPGIYVNTPQQAQARVAQGFRYIVITYEFGIIADAWRNTIAQLPEHPRGG